ncbi:hypothetical protein FKM82_030606 [Ascaphus truei]
MSLCSSRTSPAQPQGVTQSPLTPGYYLLLLLGQSQQCFRGSCSLIRRYLSWLEMGGYTQYGFTLQHVQFQVSSPDKKPVRLGIKVSECWES